MLHQIHDRAEYEKRANDLLSAFDVSNGDGESYNVIISRGCAYENHGCISPYFVICICNCEVHVMHT